MPLIEVTNAAEDRIRQLLSRDGKLETHGLRLKVVGGGCSDASFNTSANVVSLVARPMWR